MVVSPCRTFASRLPWLLDRVLDDWWQRHPLPRTAGGPSPDPLPLCLKPLRSGQRRAFARIAQSGVKPPTYPDRAAAVMPWRW